VVPVIAELPQYPDSHGQHEVLPGVPWRFLHCGENPIRRGR
jgi:hypothetical protein